MIIVIYSNLPYHLLKFAGDAEIISLVKLLLDHFVVVVATAVIDISLFRRIDQPDVDSSIRDFTNIIHVFLYIYKYWCVPLSLSSLI